MVEKYLNNNERIVFQSSSFVNIDEDPGFAVFLTNQRLILLNRKGLIFKKDRVIDIILKHINGVNLLDEGLIFKKRYLTIRGPNDSINLFGAYSDLQALYKKLNEQLSNL